jgi:large subunit ribosomal protein L25
MQELKLKAEIREEKGKEAVKKLRRQGFVPAVVYKGKDSLDIKILSKDFLNVIHTKAGENVIVDLELEGIALHKGKAAGRSKKPRTVIIKEIQYHPVRGDILHVDFHGISLTEMLTVKVPITVKGEAEGIKEGGVLEHILWEVEVECLPAQIPEKIAVDVSALKIGDSILVADLKAPAEVKILDDPKATVITLAAPQVEKEEEEKPEEELAEPEVITEKKPKEEEDLTPEEGEKK